MHILLSEMILKIPLAPGYAALATGVWYDDSIS